MATLAEIEEGLAGEVRLIESYRLDDNAGAAQKCIALASGVRANLAPNHNGKFHEVGGADAAVGGVVDELCELDRLRLGKENCG